MKSRDYDGDEAWEHLKNTIKPYTQKKPKVLPPPAKPKAKTQAFRNSQPAHPALPPLPKDAPHRSLHLSTSETGKIRKQNYAIEKRIDLHGYSRDQAFNKLLTFIASCYKTKKRTVLVITGKGGVSQESKGVLRESLPLWLEHKDIRPYVIGYSPAAPHDGGNGAFYVRLRSIDKA